MVHDVTVVDERTDGISCYLLLFRLSGELLAYWATGGGGITGWTARHGMRTVQTTTVNSVIN